MTDINEIKSIVYFLPYLRVETWYVIAACIGVYAIHIFYLALAERHRKYMERTMQTQSLETPYESAHRALSALRLDDPEFFMELNFIIRSYLELSGHVTNAVKKTTDEVIRWLPSEALRTLLETCSMYEYARDGGSDSTTREAMHTLTREIIEELHSREE